MSEWARAIGAGAALAAGLGLAGCFATPLPNPPDVDPPQPTGMNGLVTEGLLTPFLVLTGEPGAATPSATLRVTPLDTRAAPVDAAVDAEGAFEVTVDDVSMGSELRLQFLTDEGRSAPVDARVATQDGFLREADRPSCVVASPALELLAEPGELAALEVRNDCDAAVELSASLRRGGQGWTLRGEGGSIAAGESLTLEVEAGAEPAEETLRLEVTGGAEGARPITLRLQ